MAKRKFYKKYVTIEKTATGFKKAYYNDYKDEEMFCGEYTPSWSISEIKEDVVNELNRRFG